MDTELATPERAVATAESPALHEPIHVPVAGHDLTIYVESPPLIAAMLDDLRAAKQRIWLEIYIILNDAAGRAVAEVLKEKAQAGLDVRVLYDAVGSQSTPASFFRYLERAGVKVHCFHSLWEAFYRFSFLRILNRRNHRKLLVIDDRVAYFGGMNIVDQASTAVVERAERLPSSAGWRDVHVRLTGPQQAEIAESFERSWQRAHGEKIKRRSQAYRRGTLAGGEESIQFFDSGPGMRYTRAARVFMRLIRTARRKITFSMAYFVPVGPVRRLLLQTRRRGIRVQVVVPGVSDVRLVQAATRHFYMKLLRRGFHVYERQVHMLHSKVMIVDDAWTVLGSCNFDARSLWINYEFLAVIHSRTLAAVMNGIVQHEIARSQRVTMRAYRQRTWLQRQLDRLAWSCRWWL